MHIRIGWLVLFALVGGAASILRVQKGRRSQESDRQDSSKSAKPTAADKAKPAAKTKTAAKTKPAAKPKAAQPSDFTKVEGIGPKIRQILDDGGIRSFDDLASSSAEDLRAILEKAGSRYRVHDPSTWPQQAALAAAGKWDELEQLQQELKGGRKA